MLKFACNWHYKLQNVSSKILDYPSPRQNQISCRFFVSFFIPLIKKNYYSFFFCLKNIIILFFFGRKKYYYGSHWSLHSFSGLDRWVKPINQPTSNGVESIVCFLIVWAQSHNKGDREKKNGKRTALFIVLYWNEKKPPNWHLTNTNLL